MEKYTANINMYEKKVFVLNYVYNKKHRNSHFEIWRFLSNLF